MANKPVLSIIVPVYNSEKSLVKCLDSILAQTFKNFECIVVDDGSSDRSPVICDEYADKDTRIIVIHKKNEGVSTARNDGIRAACGKYIAFVDSDDYIMPEMYSLLTEKIEHEKGDTVCCGYTLKKKEYLPPSGFRHTSIAQTVFQLERAELFGLVWNKLYILKIIKESHILFPDGYYFGEDMFFNLQYFSAITSVCCIDKALYVYCENSASVSKIRPPLEQCLARFNNNSSQIIRLPENKGEQYINRILALDFTYTVFLLRSLYKPNRMIYKKRKMLTEMVKLFYRTSPAKRDFRNFRYTIFYYSLMLLPFFLFDPLMTVLFV
jgi:glycosyltransferase involved in cell wall biosynthesis